MAIRKDGEFGTLGIPDISFMGKYVESSNSTFLLGWSDSDPEQKIGGYREKGEGRYVLLKNGQLLLNGRLERPNDGKVANNGNFIINDWRFGPGLKGTFYAFDQQGRAIVQHAVSANLYNNSISDDGCLAVCHTANSDNDDGGKLYLFDLTIGRLVWKRRLESGWPNYYKFDGANRLIKCGYNGLGVFSYDMDGVFLESERFEHALIARGEPRDLLNIGLKLLESCKDSGDRAAMARASSLLKQASPYLGTRTRELARAFRALGELSEQLGNKEEAIDYYRQALQIDPKVGVKSRLKNLIESK